MKRTELRRKKPWLPKIKPREPRTPPEKLVWQGIKVPDEMEMRGCSSTVEQPPSKRRGAGSSPANSTTLKRSGPIKARPKPSTPARKAAKGQPCLIRLPGCAPGAENETVVGCHNRKGFHGGGMKPGDDRIAFGCFVCHEIVDGRRPLPAGWTRAQVDKRFEQAVADTQRRMKDLQGRK